MGQTEWSTLVESICAERGLSVVLSWDMPQGYETANGTFDPVAKRFFSIRPCCKVRRSTRRCSILSTSCGTRSSTSIPSASTR